MFSELFGPLIGLDDEWRQQGASEDEINMTAFNWDYVERIECGGLTGLLGGDPSSLKRPTSMFCAETRSAAPSSPSKGAPPSPCRSISPN